MGYLSVEEFVEVQAAHPQFLEVAMLFPKLRYQLYLEEDPLLREDRNAMPQINPVFAKAIAADRWHIDIRACNMSSDRGTTFIHCKKFRWWERAKKTQPLRIPPQMILFQPAPWKSIYTLCYDIHHDISRVGGREWMKMYHELNNKFDVAPYKERKQSLQKNIDAVLNAVAKPLKCLDPRAAVRHVKKSAEFSRKLMEERFGV